jgi:hypothetical protein
MAYTSDPQSVADLLPPPALDDVRAFLLAYLSVPANKVDDWLSGAVLRTMWEIESRLKADLAGPSLVALVENGYPDTATGESLKRLAHGWYGSDPAAASPATQTVTLFCAAGFGPYTTAQVAAVFGISSDGARYLVTAGAGTLNTSSTVTVTMTAEAPGRAAGLVALCGPLPGVSVQAAAIASFGSDGGSDADLATAIDARFDDFEVPTQDRLVFWALQAAPAPLITRFRRDADPAYPGGVLVTLANAGGPVGSGTVDDVNAAFDDLSPITDVNTAQDSSTHTINASGTVTVRTALLARAQTQADAAWAASMSGAQIGAKVYLQTLREIVGDAIKADPGSNFTGAALSGAGGDGNVVLSATEVPVAGGTLTSQLTWVGT